MQLPTLRSLRALALFLVVLAILGGVLFIICRGMFVMFARGANRGATFFSGLNSLLFTAAPSLSINISQYGRNNGVRYNNRQFQREDVRI